MGITAKFGDLPGHEFHGNQYASGASGVAGRLAGGGPKEAAAYNLTKEAMLQTETAHYTYGNPKVAAHVTAAKAHREAATAHAALRPKYPGFDNTHSTEHGTAATLHTQAAAWHDQQASQLRGTYNPRGFVKSGWKPGSLDGPYRGSGPLKDARDAMLKGKFGRNVVRQLTKIGVRY